VRITYAEAACPGDATEVTLALRFTPARPADFTLPTLPDGANPAERRMLLQVVIDLDGQLQRVTYAGGPAGLRQAAVDAASKWRAEPARVNGAPVPTATLVGLEFK
jgi:hypothetical protein